MIGWLLIDYKKKVLFGLVASHFLIFLASLVVLLVVFIFPASFLVRILKKHVAEYERKRAKNCIPNENDKNNKACMLWYASSDNRKLSLPVYLSTSATWRYRGFSRLNIELHSFEFISGDTQRK